MCKNCCIFAAKLKPTKLSNMIQNPLHFILRLPDGVALDDNDVNYTLLFAKYKVKALMGDAEALYALGVLYFCALGTEWDGSKVFHSFYDAAMKGHPLAQYNCYLCGIHAYHCKQNFKAGVYWLKEAVKQNVPEAILPYADLLRKGKPEWNVAADPALAAQYYARIADTDLNAANTLALMYHNGEGVERNYAESVRYYKKAEAMGSANALYCLGNDAAWGTGMKQDIELAIDYYIRGIRKGNKRDICQCFEYGKIDIKALLPTLPWDTVRKISALADDYYFGRLPLPDSVKDDKDYLMRLFDLLRGRSVNSGYGYAICLYRRGEASETMEAVMQLVSYTDKYPDNPHYREACYILGEVGESLYLCDPDDPGSQELLQNAVDNFQKAAKAGFGAAMWKLGKLYLNGMGVQADLTQGFSWIQKAAQAGYTPAYLSLGLLYDQGIGCKKSAREAFYWYKEGYYKGNDKQAGAMLANMYFCGTGTPKNFKEAYFYARKCEGDKLGISYAIIAECLAYGYGGVQMNTQEAVEYAKRSLADNPGNVMAQDLLRRLRYA